MAHLEAGIEILKNFKFEEERNGTRIVKEPIGVCGMITPWNWPIFQVACKVVPALATGCTMVLKPSEEAPFSAYIGAQILDAAGVPAGVFNLVNGTGADVRAAFASHPEVDMVSFTGSTRAGIEVAKAAAATVKRVTQELGEEPTHHPRRRGLPDSGRRLREARDAELRTIVLCAHAHAGALVAHR